MKTAQLCQPQDPKERYASTAAKVSAMVREMGHAGRTRITNATTDQNAPWQLFAPPARQDGEDHRRWPSRIGDRRVWLESGAGPRHP